MGVTGTPPLLHLGRDEPVLFDMVGFTINCIPVRVTVAPEMSYKDLMTHVHDAFVFARDYQVPWNMLMPLLGDIGASCVAPLFNYLYAAQEAKSTPPSSSHGGGGGFAIEPLTVEGPEQTNSVDHTRGHAPIRHLQSMRVPGHRHGNRCVSRDTATVWGSLDQITSAGF